MTSLLRAPVKRVSTAAGAGLQIGPGERPLAPVRRAHGRGATAGGLPTLTVRTRLLLRKAGPCLVTGSAIQ